MTTIEQRALYCAHDLGLSNPRIINAEYSTQEGWEGIYLVLVEGEVDLAINGVPTGRRIRGRELIAVS